MKDTMNILRNKIVLVLTILLFSTGITQAQIFIMDEDVEGNIRLGDKEFTVPVPYQGTDLDEYLPLDGGWLLLSALGGAYLLKKKKKKSSTEKWYKSFCDKMQGQ